MARESYSHQKYSVSSDVAGRPKKVGLGDALGYQRDVGNDQMKGNDPNSGNPEALKMGEGNILEAHGRDVSNNSVDVDGWGGPDAPYAGMATDAPYGAGSGMKGSSSAKSKR